MNDSNATPVDLWLKTFGPELYVCRKHRVELLRMGGIPEYLVSVKGCLCTKCGKPARSLLVTTLLTNEQIEWLKRSE